MHVVVSDGDISRDGVVVGVEPNAIAVVVGEGDGECALFWCRGRRGRVRVRVRRGRARVRVRRGRTRVGCGRLGVGSTPDPENIVASPIFRLALGTGSVRVTLVTVVSEEPDGAVGVVSAVAAALEALGV